MSTQPPDVSQEAFAFALRAVRDAPEAFEHWDRLEGLCDVLQTPDAVAEAYLRMLAPARADLVRDELGKRAVAFHDTWYGDDPAALLRVLERILEVSPGATWAFDRLVSVLTAAERWDDLLEAYDRALSGRLSPERLLQLLDDAAHVAKDFTAHPERALKYIRELLRLEPGAQALCASLERVLTEREAYEPLIGLWKAQIEATPESSLVELRLRIARVHLAHLNAPKEALEEAQKVLAQRPGDDQACALLEGVLAVEHAAVSLRLQSLALLRIHHDSADRPLATLAALERALTFAPESELIGLHREIGARLMVRADHAAALSHYAEVLRRAPSDSDARAQLERLAALSGDHKGHLKALLLAAEQTDREVLRAELLLEAMTIEAERLRDRDAAIALGQRILTIKNADTAELHHAAEAVERLLRGTGRDGEQIAILEYLRQSEQSPYRRRLLVAEIVRLHLGRSDPEKALQTWTEWLQEDPKDVEALSAAVVLARELKKFALEIELLRQRAELGTTAARRADLKRIAIVLTTELRDLDSAIETWLTVREEFGDEADLLSALDELMSDTERFSELAQIFEQATGFERERSLARLCRLGDVQREQLSGHAAAARAYARALVLDPRSESARAGLRALLGVAACAREVTAALSQAYRATDDWKLQIELLDARLVAIENPVEQAAYLLEVAGLCERHVQDFERAQALLAKAVPKIAFDTHATSELLRLTELTGRLQEAADALHAAAFTAKDDPARSAELFSLEGRLLERVGDAKRAAEAFSFALAARPETAYETEALTRNAARSDGWPLACRTALVACKTRGFADPTLLDILGAAARERSEYPALCAAFNEALGEQTNLSKAISSALWLRLSDWYLAGANDATGAEKAAKRALSLTPNDADCLQVLANVQRLAPNQSLLDTLILLDERSTDSVDPLVEAAEWLARLEVDPDRQCAVLTRLYRRAAELWTRKESSLDGERWVLWALERVIPLELSASRPERALYLLDDAVRLPLSAEARANLRRQGALILEQRGQLAEALHLGRSVLEDRPNDVELARWVADLASRLGRIGEELFLRKQQLALTTDLDARLSLRLEVARLTGILEERDGRLSMLRANLSERPGHESSLEQACTLLEDKHRLHELLSLLTSQAEAVSALGDHPFAIALWKRAAVLSETRLHDHARAISALEEVALLEEDPLVFDQLVRLCRVIDDRARASRWLSRRLAVASAGERQALLLELARTQLWADEQEAALATLHVAFNEDPRDLAVRSLLIDQLRSPSRRSELAAVLARAANEARDKDESFELALQAARIYESPLDNPHALVAVSDLALSIRPGDPELCGMMADGLRALGRLEEARQVLTHLLAQYGRRRSPERATAHVRLAEILRDEEDLAGSCAQLELALNMRPDDVAIMVTLAERAAEAADFVRRERALRALLLLAKRAPVVVDAQRTLGPSELLFELSDLSRTRGDIHQANKLQESALEALRPGDAECERIKRRLREQNSTDLLEKILRQELAHAVTAAERATAMGALAEQLALRPNARDEAFALRLSALELDPGDPHLHDAAEATCSEEQVPRLRALLERLRERARRPSDAYARCEVCLRLAELHITAGDYAVAASLLADAEATSVRESDVLRAQLRLAQKGADTAYQDALLAKLEALGCAELKDDARSDVVYRLAEIRLASEHTYREGVERLRDALRDAPRPLQAARILLRVWADHKNDKALIELFRDIARAARKDQFLQIADLCANASANVLLTTLVEGASSMGLDPQTHASLLHLCARLLLRDNPQDRAALPLLREACALVPDAPEAEALLLTSFAECGERESLVLHVRARFDRAMAKRDGAACAHYALLLHQHNAEESEVIAMLRDASQLAPENREITQALLARLSGEQHVYERAEVLEQLIERGDTEEARSHALEAADLYEACGENVAAVRVIQLARRKQDHLALVQKLCVLFREQDDVPALAAALTDRANLESDAGAKVASLREAADLLRTRHDDHERAAALLAQAVAVTPTDSTLRRDLATDYLALDRTAEATEQLERAAEYAKEDDERGRILFVRGSALLGSGQVNAGLADLVQAFDLSAGDVGTELLEALEIARQRAQTRQRRDEERALTLCMAKMRKTLSDLPESARLVEGYVAHGEAQAEDIAMLVEIYGELNWQDDLARNLVKLVALVGGSERRKVRDRLLSLVNELEDRSELVASLERAHEVHPELEELEEVLIAALVKASDDIGIAHALTRRAERTSDERTRKDLLSQAAKYFANAGAEADATNVLEQLHAASPGDLDIAAALVDALLQQRRLDEARALLDRLVDLNVGGHPPSHAGLLCRLSDVARAQGDDELALVAMQAARDADSSDRTILARLAVLAEELHSWAVAENALATILLLKGPPEVLPRAEVFLRRARVAEHHSGARRALLWARKALEAAPDSEDASLLVAQLEAELA